MDLRVRLEERAGRSQAAQERKGKDRRGVRMDEETSSRESYGSNRKGDRQPVVTFCVVCEYESETDFDICPRCGSEGRAVLVVRKA